MADKNRTYSVCISQLILQPEQKIKVGKREHILRTQTTETIILDNGLSWEDAKKLRGENKGSWIVVDVVEHNEENKETKDDSGTPD